MNEDERDTATTEERRQRKKKGVTKQVFGCVILFVGALNILFAFKGGNGPDPFDYVMLLIGAVVLALGIAQTKSV